MANLYKPKYTRTDPETGKKTSRSLRKWYGKYKDATGVTRRTPLCEDKVAARSMLADIVKNVERRVAGIIDQTTDHLDAKVSDTLQEYQRHLTGKGRSERHITETGRLIEKVLNECRCNVLADLQSADDAIEDYLIDRHESGVSHRTVNADLTAVRSFCRWLLSKRRIQNDPTIGLEHLNVEEDRRRERRALTDDEARRLIATTMKSDRVFRNLTGRDRAMIYLLAQRTGFRRKELLQLRPADFDLSGSPPTIKIEAKNAKGKKKDVLPLPADVADAVREYVQNRKRDEPMWTGSWWRRSSVMLKKDLIDAGIDSVDENGLVLDFHGQRTTFVTSLARAGVSPAVAQRLARHSDINLTLGTYTQLGIEDLQTAVKLLPALQSTNDPPASTERNLAATDDNLAQVVDAWPNLSDHIRQAIVALVVSDNRNHR